LTIGGLQTFNPLAALVDLDISQALGAVDAYIIWCNRPICLRGMLAPPGIAQRSNAALSILARAAEDLEVDFSS